MKRVALLLNLMYTRPKRCFHCVKPTQNNFFKRLNSDGVHFEPVYLVINFSFPHCFHCSLLRYPSSIWAVVMDTLLALAPYIYICGNRPLCIHALAQDRCADHSHIVLKEGVLESLPVENERFDVALCILVLHHVPDIHTVLDEVARILKPSGRFIILDMKTHKKQEFKKQMGHKHLGQKITLTYPTLRALVFTATKKKRSAPFLSLTKKYNVNLYFS